MAHILIAEDEPLLTAYWEGELVQAGHTVKVAHTGMQTLALLKDEQFDLMITDINMPDGGGFLVASEVSRMNDRIPLIAISGDPAILSTGVLGKMHKFGADAVAVKPISMDEMLKLIDQVIAAGPRENLLQRLAGLFESVGK